MSLYSSEIKLEEIKGTNDLIYLVETAPKVQNFLLKWLFSCSEVSEQEIVSIPDPLPDANSAKKAPQPESETPLRILCGAVSKDGKYLAFCDDYKQLR
jgi:aromatic ring-opening dioxygenase catalytic subunit (LigB family)